MVWRILRITIFGVAFLFGTIAAGGWNPAVLAPAAAAESKELSNTGATLVVSCAEGDPTVQHDFSAGFLRVKCESRMRIIHTQPSPAPHHFRKPLPAIPVATIVRAGQMGR